MSIGVSTAQGLGVVGLEPPTRKACVLMVPVVVKLRLLFMLNQDPRKIEFHSELD